MTINSMTGFARDAGEQAGWSWAWELKSVNAKGLDVRLRVPMGYDRLEADVRSRLSKLFQRGNISAGLMLTRSATDSGYRINDAHLEIVTRAALKLFKDHPDVQNPTADGLLGLRGVIEAEEEDVDDDTRSGLLSALLASLDSAAKHLAQARAEEGTRLEEVLNGFVETLTDLHAQAAACAETQGDEIRGRLKEQIEQLLADVGALDPQRLEQEAAVLMTKADIREELDRLAAHVASVKELMADGGAIGRRLDFLCQELNREANTICSKATRTELTRIGLDLKATIEQFREQVQNIE